MLTEAEAERKVFEAQERMRQCVRDFATVKARRDVIRTHKAEFLDLAEQERFERLLQGCEQDADAIRLRGRGGSQQPSLTNRAYRSGV